MCSEMITVRIPIKTVKSLVKTSFSDETSYFGEVIEVQKIFSEALHLYQASQVPIWFTIIDTINIAD